MNSSSVIPGSCLWGHSVAWACGVFCCKGRGVVATQHAVSLLHTREYVQGWCYRGQPGEPSPVLWTIGRAAAWQREAEGGMGGSVRQVPSIQPAGWQEACM